MYLFAPLDKHYDKGFGAVAASFQEAGTALKRTYHRGRLNGHLPICYLLRHSIELFLKGCIIIVHKGLKIPYGTEPCISEPKIPVDGKLKSIYVIHDVDLLYKYFSNLLNENNEELDKNTRTNWEFKDELGSKFERLKEIDSSSAYFRYPIEKSAVYEKDKSAFKQTPIEDVIAMAIEKQEPMKSMRVMAFVGQETQIFVHDDSFTENAMNILAKVAGEISICHTALMHELGGGGLG